jgi:chromosome segregation ATPase
MPEKTAEQLFNDAVQFKKESNKAQDKIDEIKREINKIRNELDEFVKTKRIAIRNLEDELTDWQKVKRSNNTLADEKEQQAWATRRMG